MTLPRGQQRRHREPEPKAWSEEELEAIERAHADGMSVLQEEFIARGAVQCGFCTPGLVVQGTYLLQRHADMTADDIKRGIEGNLCRCTGYKKVIDAIAAAVERTQVTR